MIGEVVGNYRILDRIGAGGMGEVYLAEHRLIGRRAAIKVLLPEFSVHQEMVNRFFNEARTTALIKHVGLIDIFDFGQHSNGCAYIAMEFLDGESLAAFLKKQPRPPTEFVMTIGRQIASAVGAAHARGIVHRDLKPDNVFLVPDDEVAIGVRAKVLDFGIAKLAGDAKVGSMKTRTGSLMGTPVYMSPEQCRGAGNVEIDLRSDVYAVGVILYEMVCGRPPFVKDGIGEVIAAHLYEVPPKPSDFVPNVPAWLEQVIMRALQKRVEDRHQSMEQLATALGGRPTVRAQHGPTGEMRPMQPTPPATLPMQSTPPPGMTLPMPTPAPALGPSADTVSAAGRSTTLSGTASQSVALPPPRKPIALYAAAAGVVVAGAAAAIFFVVRGGSQASKPGPTPVVQQAPPPTTPAPPEATPPPALTPPPPAQEAESPPEPTPPPPASKIRWRVESTPPGAKIIAKSGGKVLGTTPADIEREAQDGLVELRLERPGYRDAAFSLAGDRDDEETVKLAKKPTAKRDSGKSTGPKPKDPFKD